jgi:hypothetical protein
MLPEAPLGPAVAQGLPSGLTQPGSAGATGAAATAATAAPTRKTVVRDIFFSAMAQIYTGIAAKKGDSGRAFEYK